MNFEQNPQMDNGIIDIIFEYFHSDEIITDGMVYIGCDCYCRPRIYIIEKLSDIEYDKTTMNITKCEYEGRYYAPTMDDWETNTIKGTMTKVSEYQYSVFFRYGGWGACTWEFQLALPIYEQNKCEWNNWDEYLNRIRMGGYGWHQYRIDLFRIGSLTGMMDYSKYKQQKVFEERYPQTLESLNRSPQQCIETLRKIMSKTEFEYES